MEDNPIPRIKIKLRRSQKLKKFGQKLYLCCSNFQKNTLWESAASSSFGFIFSFIPITLIILTVLVGIFRISPGIINYALSFAEDIENIVNIRPFIDTILNMKNFHVMDIILALWIIWMARKLFLSLIQAMTKIFRSVLQRKNIFNQLIVFISEFLIVLLIAAVIIFSFTMDRLITANVFDPIREFLPEIVNKNSHYIVTVVMYSVIFLCTLLAYRFLSGTKPPILLCISCAILNNLCFYGISFVINNFFNLNKYNIVYGTISTLIILMMRVYFFFVFFWFFAQMIYVSQFFDTLLLSEIYLLPSNETKGLLPAFRRMMFVNPQALKTIDNTKFYKAGDVIFKKGDNSDCVFYIRGGSLMEEDENGDSFFYQQGDFVGEVQCILNQQRNSTGIATSDCKILVFQKKEFMDLMEKSPAAAIKAISKINDETANIYKSELSSPLA